MPNLFKLLARNLALGIVAGWIALAALIATNTGGLSDVVFASLNPLLPLGLLAFGFALTFGSLSMGAAIMMLPYGEDDHKDRGLKVHTLLAAFADRLYRATRSRELVPIRVKGNRGNQPHNRSVR
ncbi:MAG: hypothetical protein L3J67_06855 [Hyphomicrobiaceae bacterium]|nr:hypothetical protein [Hyphomicrobiaceae bacterium]